jgi:hypothetical protein
MASLFEIPRIEAHLAIVANSPQLEVRRTNFGFSSPNSMGLETNGNHEQAEEIHD